MPPTSPTRSRKVGPIPGFRAFPRPKQHVNHIEEMSLEELRDLYDKNNRSLSTSAPSTSTYVTRIQAEQAKIEERIFELEDIKNIQDGLRRVTLKTEEDMNVDMPMEPAIVRPIAAKERALAKYALHASQGPIIASGFSLQEAVQLEQQAHLLDLERKQRVLEKKQQRAQAMERGGLSERERAARILAFMNYKPTDSDLEDDSEDEDPASWFEDDQDDGRKGQDIVEPDAEDLAEVIRVDASRAHYGAFYEPRDDGD